MSESAGHFPVVAGFGEAAGGLVPPVALTAGSSVPSWPNGPGVPAGGGGGGAGEVRRFVAGHRLGDGRGRRGDLLDQGRVELIDPRDDDLVADGQAVEGGDGILVGRPEGLAIPARPVVEQRDRPEVLAAADRVGVRVLTVKVCRS